jgi:hypothetical protein
LFITSSGPRRVAAPLLAAGLSALTLGACGGSDSATGSPSENDRDTARLKLNQCLREHGIDVPDTPGKGGVVRVERDEVEKVLGGPCKKLQQAAFGSISEEDRQEFEDAFQRFAQCMRDNGVDVPDVTVGSGRGPSRARVDGNDPKVEAASRKCRSKLPRGGPGGGVVFGAGPRR